MHHDLVERRRWISEKRFLHVLNYCLLLPGSEAQQLSTYSGWLMHRTTGGIVAGAAAAGGSAGASSPRRSTAAADTAAPANLRARR